MTEVPLTLTMNAVELGYAGKAILPPISLKAAQGEVWALVGRNGSGKSTLLKTLVGQQPPVAGHMTWGAGVRLSWVPQRNAVDQSVPSRAWDVVATGVDRGWSFLKPWLSGPEKQAIRDAMEQTQTAGLARMPYSHLSEGQKQRVLIARALVSAPTALILDEPTSAMDPTNERATLECIERVRRERAVTILIASHHSEVIPFVADHALFLDREDQIVRSGPIDSVLESAPFKHRYGDVMRAARLMED